MFATNTLGVTVIRSTTVEHIVLHGDYNRRLWLEVSEESTVEIGSGDEIPYSALAYVLALMPNTLNGHLL